MKRLPEAVKRRIVEHLACYRTHVEVVELIADEFGIQLTPRHVRAYDPTSFQFAGSQRWRDHYQAVRQRCAAEIGQVAIAHRTVRLRKLQAIFDQSMARGDLLQARLTLEQAAKEMGNQYVKAKHGL